MGPDTAGIADLARRNHVTDTGRHEAPAIVFGHGFGTSQRMWRFVAPRFEEDFRVVLFDLVGSGDSDVAAYDRARYDSLHGYAADLVELLDAMNLDNVVFVGHSVSGMIGALASIRRPDLFSRLVLVGASPRYVNEGDYVGGLEPGDVDSLLDAIDSNFLAWADAAAHTLIHDPERPALTSELAESFKATDTAIARHFARVTYLSDHRAILPRVSVPTLIVQSDDDAVAPVVVGEFLAKHIPESELVVLREGGHYAHLVNPEELTGRIREFLA
ncbi:alpha/beta hydrolase [Salinibacterium sp. SYSU T00001]|uniref:alpha/beta fold hydrolase n=1 Tax=Homoserinimonas sedimenticola TaxID=2986805 RepID=UPI002235B623|nr:alpha/beta hydrolase [Salinibacterium sedimenticola]MCW4386482.1 alpha/beta hydrolase [Salinibacterium sedimenticola]